MNEYSKPLAKFRWDRLGLVALGIVLSTAGHYLTPPSLFVLHSILQRLYYLPIVAAAVWFGWKGGLFAAVCSGGCYVPYIMRMVHNDPRYAANQYAEVVLFLFVGSLTGVLTSRERRQRSELLKATERLRQANRELETRTEELRRADRLSAIGQLAASLAHEIRNPLASMDGAIDILERHPESAEEREEFLGIIRKECLRLNRLLSDLLDFARPRFPQALPAQVDEILRSVARLASASAERSGIEIRVVVSEGLPDVLCDPEQIRQVILNLTLNAIQAMPNGGTVTLAAHMEKAHILLSVTDEGPGIPEGDMHRVFDPFFSTKKGGTGLGLSVAHQIVTQHGGAISVGRNVDKGMTFTVALPLQGRTMRAATSPS